MSDDAHDNEKDHHTNGITLIPAPSDDAGDPLNWPASRKIPMFLALTWTAFIMTGAPTTHQLGFVLQSSTYNKTPVQLSYTVSAAIAGFVGGAWFYPPLFTVFGRPAVLFWGIIAQLCTQIWAAKMTNRDDFIALVISRLFSGCLALLPITIGSSYIIDAFFLHQRGRLFALFELCFLLGTFAIPTISGFILEAQAPGWTDTFWWTIGPLGMAAVLVFVFVHDSAYDRESKVAFAPPLAKPWLINRIDTFLLGWQHVRPWTGESMWRNTAAPFIIAVMPIAVVPGLYNMVAFGFSVLVQLLLTIFLQTPIEAGGYGFTPLRNAYFSFVTWVALFAAEAVGLALNDSLPMAITRRKQGRWAPEHRLWPIAVPAIVMPIGLGIYGAGLQYHLHYMVLALGQFLVQFAAQLSVPICNSYVIENFIANAVETTVAMNIWRLILAIVLPFTADSWLARTGPGWMFGIAAFLNLFVSILIILIAWKGAAVRRLSVKKGLGLSEEGVKVMTSDNDIVSSQHRGTGQEAGQEADQVHDVEVNIKP